MIEQGILQQNLSNYYRSGKADTLCQIFNKFINTLMKERQQEKTKEKYMWLDLNNEIKYMTDRKILEKYIDLEKSYLMDKEKIEVRDMIHKYKEVFSLRDEISTSPSVEVETDVKDKSPFFIRPYHVREEDKAIIDKNGMFMLLGNAKGNVFSFFQPSHVNH